MNRWFKHLELTVWKGTDMDEKPWSRLYTTRPRLVPGEFFATVGGPIVNFQGLVEHGKAAIRVGKESNSTQHFSSQALRATATFFVELADQLDGK